MSTPSPLTSASLRAHVVWLMFLSEYFLKYAQGPSVIAFIARAMSQFAQLFAFFIPLKVIIIMGSGNIPTYLRGLMTMETRDAWIVGMAIATLILYVSSIMLNILANRMERKVGDLLLLKMEAANVMQKAERKLVRRMVVLLCRTYVSLTIFSLCLFALVIIKPFMLLTLMGILFLQFGLTTWLLRHGTDATASWLGRTIGRSPAGYLKTLAAMNFLLVFVLLLLEYAITGTTNVITAILALLLGRRLFHAAEGYATRVLLLHRDKMEIDRLLSACSAEIDMGTKGA